VSLSLVLFVTLAFAYLAASQPSKKGVLVGIVAPDAIVSFDDSTGALKVLLNMTLVAGSPVQIASNLFPIGNNCAGFAYWMANTNSWSMGEYCLGAKNVTWPYSQQSDFEIQGNLFGDPANSAIISASSSTNGFGTWYLQGQFFTYENGQVQTPVSINLQLEPLLYAYSPSQELILTVGRDSNGLLNLYGFSALTGFEVANDKLQYSGSSTILDLVADEANGTFIGIGYKSSDTTPRIYDFVQFNQLTFDEEIMDTEVPFTQSTYFSSSFVSSTGRYYVIFHNVLGYQLYIYDINSRSMVSAFKGLNVPLRSLLLLSP